MKTRKNDAAKSASTPKRTPLSTKKSPVKIPSTLSTETTKSEASPSETMETKRSSSGKPKRLKTQDISLAITPSSKLQSRAGEASKETQVAQADPCSKTTRKVMKKVVKRITRVAKKTSGQTPGIGLNATTKIQEKMTDNALDSKLVEYVRDGFTTYDPSRNEIVQESVVAGRKIGKLGRPSKRTAELCEHQKLLVENSEKVSDMETRASYSMHIERKKTCLVEQDRSMEGKEDEAKTMNDVIITMMKDNNVVMTSEDTLLEEEGDGKIEGISDQEVHEEFGGEDFVDDDVTENEPENETFDGEQVELNAAARERKSMKEKEIFVGGLDRDSVEEDIKKVFKYAGEVVEVRMCMDPMTSKNKGFAFVQFATKEQASYALSEMKNPVIHGKRCGTAPIEGDDTLFLGNICNTWTKEAIKQKLKDYSIEGFENITMVADPRNEGLSRGFVFIEFSCHAEAILAHKRLQKPDVVFGHAERTAKVAFAEPQREPDPEVMAQVKSVFVDGLPPHWDEDRVRNKFKDFGEITKILLARNMSTAKRKDFGFVDFSTHSAAISCVESINSTGLHDDNSKIPVRARLSNPSPKMRAIKGGMCGGFLINRGRDLHRGVQHFNQASFHQVRDFSSRGPGRSGRVDASNQLEFSIPRPLFARSNSGKGKRWGFKGAYHGPEPEIPAARVRHCVVDRGYGHYESYRRPTYFEDGYGSPFTERHFDDSYLYDDDTHGLKRPYHLMDPDYDILEPNRHRPRLENADPYAFNRQTRFSGDLRFDGRHFPQQSYDHMGSRTPQRFETKRTENHHKGRRTSKVGNPLNTSPPTTKSATLTVKRREIYQMEHTSHGIKGRRYIGLNITGGAREMREITEDLRDGKLPKPESVGREERKQGLGFQKP